MSGGSVEDRVGRALDVLALLHMAGCADVENVTDINAALSGVRRAADDARRALLPVMQAPGDVLNWRPK
jgi:hypothetical protein